MSELKEEHLVYLNDEMYKPIHYKGMIVKQPFYKGKGNHSIAKLEEICEQFKEYCHQQAIIKQNCMISGGAHFGVDLKHFLYLFLFFLGLAFDFLI